MELSRRNLLRTGLFGATAMGVMPFGIRPAFATHCVPSVTYPLTAGQTIPVGTVTVSNDGSNLYVTYNLTYPGATFGTLHLWVGTNLNLVPKSGGGAPIPGQFPYHANPAGTSYTFTIPIADAGFVDVNQACNTTVYVVAHAEVDLNGSSPGGGETAFGGDLPGTGRRWWFYAAYVWCCPDIEPPPPPVDGCETAFAKGGWIWTTDPKSNPLPSLPSLRLIKNRWGWAINLLSPGTTYYDIWQGAGLNNTSNGTKVGSLTVNWDGTTVTVDYLLFAGFRLAETHLYAKDARPNTTAPGQYGNPPHYFTVVQNVSADRYIVPLADTNGTDGVWIIAHAVVCGTA